MFQGHRRVNVRVYVETIDINPVLHVSVQLIQSYYRRQKSINKSSAEVIKIPRTALLASDCHVCADLEQMSTALY